MHPSVLIPYVPEYLAKLSLDSAEELARFGEESRNGALALVDISGFVALTEQLDRKGKGGSERVSEILNGFYEKVISLVLASSGDVVKFLGDGFLAMWPDTEPGQTEFGSRAIRCVTAIMNNLHAIPANEGITINLSAGVAIGAYRLLRVGGIRGRWELCVVGEAVAEVARAQSMAKMGSIVFGPSCQVHPAELLGGKRDLDGFIHARNLPHSPSSVSGNPAPHSTLLGATDSIASFIPRMVVERLRLGQDEWIAEIRRLTILFVRLGTLDDIVRRDGQFFHEMLQLVQRSIYKHEGSLNKLVADDKGVVALCAFGIAPLFHEDYAIRAVNAAFDIEEALRRVKIQGAFGITTGRVFCGPIGARERKEYSLIGDVVNTASRLMQAAPSGIFCDQHTKTATKSDYEFEQLSNFRLKGRSAPLRVYRPTARRVSRHVYSMPLVGRKSELAQLSHALSEVLDGNSRLILVEGEAGIGKSRLLSEVVELAKRHQILLLSGAGISIEVNTPYHAWRNTFQEMLGAETLRSNPASLIADLEKLLGDNSEHLQLLPLLNTVLNVNFPENEFTTQLEGEVRAHNTRRLLRKLVECVSGSGPVVFALEDTHWFDSASWELVKEIERNVDSCLMILTSRPRYPKRGDLVEEILNQDSSSVIHLTDLNEIEMEILICQRIGAVSLAHDLRRYIWMRGDGNPFFCEEITSALLEEALIVVSQGECKFQDSAQSAESLSFPDTIEGVISSRIDRLPHELQLSLKVASVVGRIFAAKLVQETYPVSVDRHRVGDFLLSLKDQDFTRLHANAPDLEYYFRHAIAQEVTYSLLTQEQRKKLHRSIAEIIETSGFNAHSTFYAVAAYHWESAEEPSKAIVYLERAGWHALRNDANAECIIFFQRITKLEQLPDAGERTVLDSAGSERAMGTALYNLGRLSESREHLLRALEILGQGPPRTKHGLFLSIFSQLMADRVRIKHPINWDDISVERNSKELAEAANIYGELSLAYYFEGDFLSLIHSVFRAVLFARRAAVSEVRGVLALATARLGAVYGGVFGATGVADIYIREATDIAKDGRQNSALGSVLLAASLHHMMTGHWAKCVDSADQAREVFDKLHDRRQWDTASNVYATGKYFLGKLGDSILLSEEYANTAKSRGDHEMESLALAQIAMSTMLMRGPVEASHSSRRAMSAPDHSFSMPDRLFIHATASRICAEQGDFLEAQKLADDLYDDLSDPPSNQIALGGYFHLAEVYLILWERQLDGEGPVAPDLEKRSNDIVNLVRYNSRKFSTGFKPMVSLLQGWKMWLEGRRAKAHRLWRTSAHLAHKSGLRFFEGRVCYEVATRLALNHQERLPNLERAAILFEDCQAQYYSDLVKKELSRSK